MFDTKIYGDLIFSKRHELDIQAYANYYDSFDLSVDVFDTIFKGIKEIKTRGVKF